LGILGGGTQDSDQATGGGQGQGTAGKIIGAVVNSGKSNPSNTNAEGVTTGKVGNISVKGNLSGIDAGFYGHMTVTSARKNFTITGAGDVFNKTKEDKAFSRTSNLSSKKGDCRKAK
jgi:hypothetical protein